MKNCPVAFDSCSGTEQGWVDIAGDPGAKSMGRCEADSSGNTGMLS